MHYNAVMSTITLKDVPKKLHHSLKEQAKAHGRSLNKEVIATLEASLSGNNINTADLINQARLVRECTPVYMTAKDLDAYKNDGRK